MMRWLLSVSVLLLLGWPAHAADAIVRYPLQEANPDPRGDYFLNVLKLVLAKTESSHGPVQLQMADIQMPQGRALESLMGERRLDVVWAVTSVERELALRPIRVPLDMGLFGYRVLLIRASDSARFATMHSLTDLTRLRAGQGHDWPDTVILRNNGLTVETSGNYPNLFTMLAHGRFDYFPRSVAEVGGELRGHKDSGLVLEPRLLLHYPSAVYFFVDHGNTALAERLEAGLNVARADGSFMRLFNQHPGMQEALNLLRERQRLVLRLRNPLLPESTPLSDRSLWLQPESLWPQPAPVR